jgi:hypothetical protein
MMWPQIAALTRNPTQETQKDDHKHESSNKARTLPSRNMQSLPAFKLGEGRIGPFPSRAPKGESEEVKSASNKWTFPRRTKQGLEQGDISGFPNWLPFIFTS